MNEDTVGSGDSGTYDVGDLELLSGSSHCDVV